MKTISKEFEGIYGNGRPLNIRANKTIDNMLRNIPEKHYVNNVTNLDTRNVYDEEEFPYGIVVFMFVILVLGALYYYRDTIYNFIYSKEIEEKKMEEREQKEKAEREQIEKNNIKLQEESEKKKQEEINKGGVKQLEDKINTLSGYKQEQLVKENSYCYIGTDNGQRECTSAYAGDVCMSGHIFPKMEICINPNLRV